ncbi:MAG: YggS family pyridoxal phosphate-dependent enzyme [Gammaproteobacteria bacterium]|nr:YggS family pyridoxal phosphate-dependent enzyme [Gammaproteobacteria bacterium]
MIEITHNLTTLRARITKAAIAAGRDPETIRLIAVSKLQPIEKIRDLHAAKLRDFGENYVQEAVEKQMNLPNDICWHFIGRLQSNKCKTVAKHFSWIHSVDRINIAERLHHYRADSKSPLNVCIQVKQSGQQSKSGVNVSDLKSMCAQIADLPHLKLRGLMTLPEPTTDLKQQINAYEFVVNAFQALQKVYNLDTLSLGSSNDFETAIAMGSTMVRIGTELFGPRSTN